MGNVRDEDRLNGFFEILSLELNSLSASGSKKFAIDRQIQRMRKRALYERPALQVAAFEKFKRINNEVGSTVLSICDDIVANAREFILNSLERYTTTIDPESVQMSLYMPHLLDNWRFGPGASNGVKGSHTADKIRQAMTCTTLSVPLVRTLRADNAYFRLFDESGNCGVHVVDGSRMTTVPKNEDTVRTIAIEPSGSMALQLAAGRYLEGALRYIGLDITRQQPLNKALALAGSIDGSFATIDLSSASDMISLDLVRLLFPPEWYRLFVVLRSPTTELPGGEKVTLNMISTMGNGFTFPLMSFIFSALLYAFRCRASGSPRLFIDWGTACVFGDDIILQTHEYDGFVEVLSSAGFVVNYDKSYSAGPFRESCGGDYHLGVDVTPFYVKTLRTTSDVYVALNQLLFWAGKHEVVLFRSLKYLTGLIGRVFLVPEWHNPDQGLLTTLCSARYSYLSVQQNRTRRVSDLFDMPLAVGGFITQSGPHMYYLPRPLQVKAFVRKSRLPRGYLDGRCTDRYVDSVSNWVGLLVRLLT